MDWSQIDNNLLFYFFRFWFSILIGFGFLTLIYKVVRDFFGRY